MDNNDKLRERRRLLGADFRRRIFGDASLSSVAVMLKGAASTMNDTTDSDSETDDDVVVDGLDIGRGLVFMRRGFGLRRKGWKGKGLGMWIALEEPDPHSKMTEPYIYLRTAEGGFIPWNCSQADLLASDWEVIREERIE